MGIPKFFRWISERYPLTSQLITPSTIPTFDNLYLDMNGIIHNCSHPPSTEGDMHFRITEEQMILAVYAYIDHLFTKIKPRKVFYMAIDGCAPRAKMNQQRSRRFRTAKENKEAQEKAERAGEVLPEEKAFDSNCITPGTPFMARLSKHLEYFINKKISEDSEWRGVKVIFSGHDVPGEGEHKIQEFIRLNKAQPDYNPNTRHCLYGLDADLIMLGLLSHDPHFCLLREEVTFGRNKKKSGGLSQQNFFLLHLSLLREYLDLEFSSIAEAMPFDYDLERIIDDFILLSVFVGNDFLPHLPNLHINEGAMEEIWNIYKRVLPVAGGYMNNNGTIDVARVQLVLNELAKTEIEYFEREYSDLSWFKGKQEKELKALENAQSRGKLVLTKNQRAMFDKVESFVLDLLELDNKDAEKVEFVNNLPARDRTFIQDLADALHLDLAWDGVDEYGQSLVVIAPGMLARKESPDTSVPASVREPVSDEESDEAASSDDEDAEGRAAVKRVLEKYRKARVIENIDEDAQKTYETILHERMGEWKDTYYKTKLEAKDEKDVKQVVYKYIEGLQWVMNYYYKGCSSWGWYYPYHYAPRITDFVGVGDMTFDFALGKPFKPFQQLMGVLPAASSEHIPIAYRDLMYDASSPILDFYPEDFEEDMNGKKQSWEATVKIPFIDHDRLLKAMASRDHRLTADEQSRNRLSEYSTMFVYDENASSTYPSSLPGSFPDLPKNKCRMEAYALPELGDGVELITGLIDGVHLGASALAGFPSMKTLPHHAQLNHHAINVHGQDSKNISMVITIDNAFDSVKTSELAAKMVGERTFLYWPFLQEGMVVALSDELFRYEKGPRGVVATPHEPNSLIDFRKKSHRIESHYSKRFGVVTGQIDVIMHVRPLLGLKRMDDGSLIKDYSEKEKETEQAIQMAVRQVAFEDERFLEQNPPSLPAEFPRGTKVLFLGDHAYGAAAQVTEATEQALTVELAYFANESREPEVYSRLVQSRPNERYHPNPLVARGLGVSPLAMSRIMSTVLIETGDGRKYNIGLSLKFDAKGLKVLGYSRKNDRGWEFSQAAYELCARYKDEFPDVFERLDGHDRGIARSKDMFPEAPNPDTRVKQVREWLKDNGVLDLEPVSLFAEQLDKGTVKILEKTADEFNAQRHLTTIKRVVIKAVPRQALLKPVHAIYRLQGQVFAIGDRVIMVQDAAVGGVPFSLKGVVIGLNATSIDVVWDSPFIGGETLSGRCSEHRGSIVPFASCLNLTRKQFAVGKSTAPKAVGREPAFQPRFGPQPVVPGQHFKANQNFRPQVNAASQGFRPRPPQQGQMQYGNAAQGIRPRPAPSANTGATPQVQILHQALTGKTGPVRPPRGRGGFIARPVNGHPVQASPALAGNGPAHAPAVRPSRGGHAGRGGAAGRGRGGSHANGSITSVVNANTPTST